MPLAALDLDGTLVDQGRAAQAWATEFAAEWRLSEHVVATVSTQLAGRGPKDVAFEQIVSTLSLPVAPDDLWASYRQRMPQLVSCSDADKAALTRLRDAGWTIGIVTNGMADNQAGKIRSTGLAELVDGWVISSEVGFRKPEPGIFRALAERLHCRLDGWMIGDSLEHDIAGGAACGLHTAWIAPVESRASPRPVPTITALTVAAAVEKILM